MPSKFAAVIVLLAGAGIGGLGVHALHAQSNPPVYFIAEIDVQNVDGYTKEYVPKAVASLKAHGGRIIVATQKITPFEGEPPKGRVVAHVWESMEQLQGWYRSPEYQEVHHVGAKHAKYRTFAVEGITP